MLRLLSDENFNGDIVRGLRLRRAAMDVVRVQDIGQQGQKDQIVLAWAADNNRIILTHDRATMPYFAHARVAATPTMSGIFVVNDRYPVGLAIEHLLLIEDCSEHVEWNGKVVYLPL